MKKWLGQIDEDFLALPGVITLPAISRLKRVELHEVDLMELSHGTMVGNECLFLTDAPEFSLETDSDSVELCCLNRGGRIKCSSESVRYDETVYLGKRRDNMEQTYVRIEVTDSNVWSIHVEWQLITYRSTIASTLASIVRRNEMVTRCFNIPPKPRVFIDHCLKLLCESLQLIPKEILEDVGIVLPVTEPIDVESLMKRLDVTQASMKNSYETHLLAGYGVKICSDQQADSVVEIYWNSYERIRDLPSRAHQHVLGLVGRVPLSVQNPTDGLICKEVTPVLRLNSNRFWWAEGLSIARLLLRYQENVLALKPKLDSIHQQALAMAESLGHTSFVIKGL